MKKFLLLSFMLTFVFSLGETWAQERTVSGKVTSIEDGSALPGVNVVLKGTTMGTVTDVDGNYSLSVPSEGGTIVFSFIGLATEEVAVGTRSVIDVQMSPDVQQLSEVVVTAVGIEREKRSLGYAITSVDAQAVERRSEPDIGRILNGKIPGVNITPATGVSGTGTNIIIRGYSSVNLDNQPLFVVDGVPFNTNTNTQGGFTGGSLNASSRFLDIDPNNIASVEVLKGLSATVKYGEQGRNGVILITTKGGRAGFNKRPFEVSVTQSYFRNEIASLPEYQNSYGAGFHQSAGFFFSNWGAHFDDIDSVNHPYSAFSNPDLLAAFPEFQGKRYAYKAYSGPEDFFRKGSIYNTSLNFSANTEKATYNATIGYNKEEGFVPNNDLERINFGFGVNTQLTERFNVNTTMNVALTETSAPPLGASTGSSAVGDGSALFANVLYTPRSVDLMGLPFESPIDNRSVYYRGGNDIPNPNWLVKYTRSSSDVQRFFGRTALSYEITDELSATYRVGIDNYNEAQEYLINKGIGPGPANSNLNLGLYRTTSVTNTIWNHDFLLAYSKDITEDLGLSALAGVTARLDRYSQDGIESTEQNAFGFVEHGNFVNASSTNSFTGGDLQYVIEENIYGAYADVTLDFRNFLYLNLQGRNDWSSTVEEENQSKFYPSASLSFIPTSAFSGLQSDMVNFIKVRGSFATAAGFPNPYNTRSLLSANSRAFVDLGSSPVATNGTSNRLGNPKLGPELLKEVEFGLEAKFLRNRLGIDVTLYNRTTEDLITDVPLDPATGYTTTLANIGSIENKGIELALTGTPLQIGAFRWDLIGNFFAYKSEVTELADGLDVIDIAGFSGFALNSAIKGEPYNVIRTTVAERDPNGNMIVNANGDYEVANDVAITGDPNPDWTASLISNMSWKGINFSMQWDYRKGGDIFSITAGAVVGRGLAKSTEFDREQTVILPGVRQDGVDGDGNPVYVPNDIQITATDAYFNNIGFGPGELRVFDGSTIRLREISLGYDLPKTILDKTPLNGVNVTFSGNNLWFLAYNFPKDLNFDPEVMGTGVGNGLGLDFLTGPSAKRYGVSLKVTF
ncbi:TonB-dependent receptor [Fulvivirga imtechensis AK7]|uniref:TonB-dependent receptor n=1 Tax=Fulvivirga imtechensis AK7 TaxID=1237149 RepID=L8JMH4_9BACT|nr:SusC/RagA family TonB-linked outer membrane protein [Fulvivirga imtechensis]ELR69423.1 TonB-dependent receptor [Fulvivirga imtechensis AK7]